MSAGDRDGRKPGNLVAILIDHNSRILIQGITGSTGRDIAARMIEHRSPLVAGVTPGKGGTVVSGVPVFDSCYEAVAETGVDASFAVVPPAFVKEACLEAVDAGLKLAVVYTERVPLHDAMAMAAVALARGTTLLGPNAAGCVTPGEANLSDFDDANLDGGRIGIVSKSGTLAAEVVAALRTHGLGESTVVCLGGDAITGTDHAAILRLFEQDDETDAVVLIGEIGGRSELVAAEFVAGMSKPVVAYIAGRCAPPRKAMGHAGAIVAASGDDSASAKMSALDRSGARVAQTLAEIVSLIGSIR